MKKGIKETLNDVLGMVLTGFFYGVGFWLAAFMSVTINVLT